MEIISWREKNRDIAGGCAPEASTLPPATVSRCFFKGFPKYAEPTEQVVDPRPGSSSKVQGVEINDFKFS